jgi:hypothetical protein
MDLKNLPKGAVTKCQGSKGIYYEINYEIQLTFRQELVIACLVEGKVVARDKLVYS